MGLTKYSLGTVLYTSTSTVHFQDNMVFYIADSDLMRGVCLVHCFPVQVYIAYVCVYESDMTQKHESNPNPNDLICPIGSGLN